MFLFGGLDLLRGGSRQLRSKVGVLVRPLVADAITLGDNARGHSGVGPRNLHDVEADFLTEYKPPAIVAQVAII